MGVFQIINADGDIIRKTWFFKLNDVKLWLYFEKPGLSIDNSESEIFLKNQVFRETCIIGW